MVRNRNNHNSSHPWSQKWGEKVSKVKEKIRDESGKTDRENRQEVRELGWQATRTPNSLGSHSFI